MASGRRTPGASCAPPITATSPLQLSSGRRPCPFRHHQFQRSLSCKSPPTVATGARPQGFYPRSPADGASPGRCHHQGGWGGCRTPGSQANLPPTTSLRRGPPIQEPGGQPPSDSLVGNEEAEGICNDFPLKACLHYVQRTVHSLQEGGGEAFSFCSSAEGGRKDGVGCSSAISEMAVEVVEDLDRRIGNVSAGPG